MVVVTFCEQLFTGFVKKSSIEDLLKECAKMIEFDHPNVLRICVDGGPTPYIIMPLMINGSLLTYLREQRAHLLLDPTSSTDHDLVVSETEPRSRSLIWTVQIHVSCQVSRSRQ